MSCVYLVRNVETKKWLSDARYEVEDFAKASCRYWSEKAARKSIKDAVSSHKSLNAHYEEHPAQKWVGWKPYPEHYEVVVFKLVEVGSLG